MDMTQIYKDYSVYLYNYALKLTCHPEDALDVVQDTFLKAWKSLDSLENEKALAGWLRKICFREFLTKTKKEKEKYFTEHEDVELLEQEGRKLQDISLSPEDEVIVAEEIKSLQNGCFLAMVRKLSLNQRILFSLVDMFGLDISYVAEILEISKGAAKGLLYRARMNIDSFYADHCSLLYEKNPCSCKAWIDFSTDRASLQKKAGKLTAKLDAEKSGYQYREEVRRKIKYLYSHMPEQKPDAKWYEKVLHSLEK